MHEILVNCLGGLSLPRKSVVRLTDRPDMTLDVYRGRKTTNQQNQPTQANVSNGITTLQGEHLFKSKHKFRSYGADKLIYDQFIS